MSLKRVDTKEVIQDLLTSVVNTDVDGTPFLQSLNANWTDIKLLYGNADDNVNTINANEILSNNPLALIFLPRGIKERYDTSVSSNIYIDANIKLYLLVSVNMENTDVLGHYSKAIDPCKEIWNQLINNSDNVVTTCELIEESNLTDHIQFGLIRMEFGKKGQRILDGKYSGIEIDFNLKVLKQLKCN